MTAVMDKTRSSLLDFSQATTAAGAEAPDRLTGLPTRTELDAHLGACLGRSGAEGGLVGVFYADVDRLRLVNDGFGHRAGDEILRCVARRLHSLLGPADLVARFGGDTFVMVCPGLAGEHEAMLVAERIVACTAEPVDTSTGSFSLALSVGVAVGREAATAAHLVRDSASAMHGVKERGGHAYAIFDPAVRGRLVREIELQRELRLAISQDELCLHYQPVVSLVSGAVVSLEALVRWDHPRHGLLSPAEFVPAAEKNGLIVPLGYAVLRSACRQIAHWTARGSTPRADWARVAVNVSAVQISDPHFIARVRTTLEESGVEPGRLAIELTETALMDSLDTADEVIAELKRMGIKVVLDDFGTGYSSLGYLARFPVDAIKLDRSFISGAAAARSGPIIEAVAGMAHALDLELVGEGVETEAQMSRLQSIGCDFAQGFLFARPMPGGEVPGWIASAEDRPVPAAASNEVPSQPRLRIGPAVTAPLPGLAAVLSGDVRPLLSTAGKSLYERQASGWFSEERSRGPLRKWVSAVAAAARAGDLDAALLATATLAAKADATGASALEVTLFLERFGALSTAMARGQQGVEERGQTARLFDHLRLQPLQAR
jgi:diguanylate cyclase (GGDEF)-like protein